MGSCTLVVPLKSTFDLAVHFPCTLRVDLVQSVMVIFMREGLDLPQSVV